MPYCSRCGVEVDTTETKCPLCDTPIQVLDDEQTAEEKAKTFRKKYPDEPAEIEPEKVKRTAKQKRFLAWEITSVSLLLPMLIVLFTNLIVTKTVDWALYPISALTMTWLLVTIPLLMPKKPVIIVIGEVLTITVFLLVVDLLDGGELNWYLNLALPTLALTAVITTGVVIGSIKSKRKGANIASYVLFGIAGISAGLDLIISSFMKGRVTIGWSLFVVVPAVLVGMFLLYVHYRVVKNVDLKGKLQL